MQHSAASDLGLHFLPVIHLRVSNLQWVNIQILDISPILHIASGKHTYIILIPLNPTFIE